MGTWHDMKARLNQKYHFTREITELKKADTLVQHFDAPNLGYIFRSQDHRVPTFKSTSYQYSHQSNTQTPAYKMDIKDKSVTSNAKRQNTKRNFFTLRPAIQCNKCQGYEHVVICSNPIKVAKVRKPLETHPELISSFIVDPYCRLLWSSTPSSSTADTKPSQSCH